MSKSIETLSTTSLLNELISRGILTQNQSDSAVKKSDRAALKAEKVAQINVLKLQISEAITTCETHVFSVKKTGNSIGVMNLVQAERSQVLKALTQLTADGIFRKVGLVGGVEKPTSEVNAFQIRYIRVTDETPAVFETNESAEEGK